MMVNHVDCEGSIGGFDIPENYMEGDSKMKVSYKGFTGELLKLEAEKVSDINFIFCDGPLPVKHAGHTGKYTRELWDEEKAAKISFSDVYMKDVKFLGGEVTFG